MAKKSKEKSYWPHMILGFLLVGVTLGYWTVKTTFSLPVQEVNEYMLKYQTADYNINEIKAKEALFDKHYTIALLNVKKEMIELENLKRAKVESSVLLHKGSNSFQYAVTAKENHQAVDANVTFLLTRPNTVKDDVMVKEIPLKEGKYTINDINISHPGRYTLQLRAKIGEAVGYSSLPAHLKPE